MKDFWRSLIGSHIHCKSGIIWEMVLDSRCYITIGWYMAHLTAAIAVTLSVLVGYLSITSFFKLDVSYICAPVAWFLLTSMSRSLSATAELFVRIITVMQWMFHCMCVLGMYACTLLQSCMIVYTHMVAVRKFSDTKWKITKSVNSTSCTAPDFLQLTAKLNDNWMN